MKSQIKAVSIASMASAAALVAVLLILVGPPTSEAAVTSCNIVANYLSPCRTYLQTGSGTPSTSCCDGAKALLRASPTTADKQKACSCMKVFAKQLNVKQSAAQALPGYCQISFPYTISPTTDCSKVT